VFTPDSTIYFGESDYYHPSSTLQELEHARKIEPIYIAQHRDQYSCVSQGTELIGISYSYAQD